MGVMAAGGVLTVGVASVIGVEALREALSGPTGSRSRHEVRDALLAAVAVLWVPPSDPSAPQVCAQQARVREALAQWWQCFTPEGRRESSSWAQELVSEYEALLSARTFSAARAVQTVRVAAGPAARRGE